MGYRPNMPPMVGRSPATATYVLLALGVIGLTLAGKYGGLDDVIALLICYVAAPGLVYGHRRHGGMVGLIQWWIEVNRRLLRYITYGPSKAKPRAVSKSTCEHSVAWAPVYVNDMLDRDPELVAALCIECREPVDLLPPAYVPPDMSINKRPRPPKGRGAVSTLKAEIAAKNRATDANPFGLKPKQPEPLGPPCYCAGGWVHHRRPNCPRPDPEILEVNARSIVLSNGFSYTPSEPGQSRSGDLREARAYIDARRKLLLVGDDDGRLSGGDLDEFRMLSQAALEIGTLLDAIDTVAVMSHESAEPVRVIETGGRPDWVRSVVEGRADPPPVHIPGIAEKR